MLASIFSFKLFIPLINFELVWGNCLTSLFGNFIQRKSSLENPSDSDFDVDIETLSEDTADTESNPSYSSSPSKQDASPLRWKKSPNVTSRKGNIRTLAVIN